MSKDCDLCCHIFTVSFPHNYSPFSSHLQIYKHLKSLFKLTLVNTCNNMYLKIVSKKQRKNDYLNEWTVKNFPTPLKLRITRELYLFFHSCHFQFEIFSWIGLFHFNVIRKNLHDFDTGLKSNKRQYKNKCINN